MIISKMCHAYLGTDCRENLLESLRTDHAWTNGVDHRERARVRGPERLRNGHDWWEIVRRSSRTTERHSHTAKPLRACVPAGRGPAVGMPSHDARPEARRAGRTDGALHRFAVAAR